MMRENRRGAVVEGPAERLGVIDARLVPAAGVAWAVAAVGESAGLTALLVVAGTVIAVALLLTGAAAEPTVRRGWAAVALAAALAGTLCTLHLLQATLHPLAPVMRLGEGHTLAVTGRVSDEPRVSPGAALDPTQGSTVVVLDIDGAEVVIFARGSEWLRMRAGDGVTAVVEVVEPPRGSVIGTVRARGAPRRVEPAGGLYATAARVRPVFRESTARWLPERLAGVASAMILGDTAVLDPSLAEDFRASGLAHLSAVSGANVTLVVGAAAWVASRLRGGPRAGAAASAATLVFFVLVVGPSAAVLRAAVVGTVALLSVVASRKRPAIPALAAGCLCLVLWRPSLSLDAGFALSVAATAGLILCAPALLRLIERWRWGPGARWAGRPVLPRPVAQALAVATAAHLVTTPITWLAFDQVTPIGLLANVAVTPVTPLITVVGTAAAGMAWIGTFGGVLGGALGGGLAGDLMSGLAGMALRVIRLALWWVATVAETTGSWGFEVTTALSALPS